MIGMLIFVKLTGAAPWASNDGRSVSMSRRDNHFDEPECVLEIQAFEKMLFETHTKRHREGGSIKTHIGEALVERAAMI